jgi:DNA-binding response OmpR family regulator
VRVLVIDDDDVIGILVGRILSREGVEVTVTEDGAAGLRIAAEIAPHLILVDSTMPGMTGVEVVKALAADPTTAAVPVVVMSADWDDASVGLRKPFSPTELVELVRSHQPS